MEAPGYLESNFVEAVRRGEWRPLEEAAGFHGEGAVVAVPPQADAASLLHPAPRAGAAAAVRFLAFLALLFSAQVVKAEEED